MHHRELADIDGDARNPESPRMRLLIEHQQPAPAVHKIGGLGLSLVQDVRPVVDQLNKLFDFLLQAPAESHSGISPMWRSDSGPILTCTVCRRHELADHGNGKQARVPCQFGEVLLVRVLYDREIVDVPLVGRRPFDTGKPVVPMVLGGRNPDGANDSRKQRAGFRTAATSAASTPCSTGSTRAAGPGNACYRHISLPIAGSGLPRRLRLLFFTLRWQASHAQM